MEQISLFEALYEKKKITKPIRLIELFAGVGAQAKALERLGANFETWKVVEFDNNPIRSYNAIHNTNYEVSDIREIHAEDLDIRERERVEYIMTYSFPCQDLSLAGKTKGMAKGSGTRSGLLWEVERILNECGENLPQILLMENVPQVIGKKNIEDFKDWELFLEKKGYQNYIKILNAKDYGIPQNRKRCFMVSILGDYYYEWPTKQPLKLKLSDMLEKEVDEKYFISTKMMEYISHRGTGKFKNPDSKINLEIARPLTTEQNKRAGTTNYVCEQLPKNYDLSLKIKEATKKGYKEAHVGDGIDISTRMETHRGTVQKGIIQTIKAQLDVGVVTKEETGLAIRKLTPRECWRLMGFDDSDYDKAEQVNTPSQLYKQAGNSIVVNVLMAIFKQLL